MTTDEKEKWCPTQNGIFTGYEPQYRRIPETAMDPGDWLRVPTVLSPRGVPEPLLCGGVLRTIGLFGYAQAQAIAWMYRAQAEAAGREEIEVRVQAYEVVYEIKARKIALPVSSIEKPEGENDDHL